MTNPRKRVALTRDGHVSVSRARGHFGSRDLLRLVVREAGVELVLDPGVPPSLMDYAAASGLGALAACLVGASIGSTVGGAFDRPEDGAAVGAAIFSLVGAYSSANAVKRGLRVRVRGPVESLLVLERP